MTSTVIGHARVLWNYFASIRQEIHCSAVVVCCSYDLRVMDYAVDVLERGRTDTVVISGDRGHWTGKLWDEPESSIFHEHARDRLNGYRVLLEQNAKNFSENIRFSLDLIRPVEEVLFMTKPNSLYRVHLTVPKVDPEIRYSVSCPVIAFPEGVSNFVGLIGLINEMVGDVDNKHDPFRFHPGNPPDRGSVLSVPIWRWTNQYLKSHCTMESTSDTGCLAGKDNDCGLVA